MNSREAIFLSYLAYHNKTELDILNNGGTLKEGTDPVWIDLWDKLKDNYNSIIKKLTAEGVIY